MNIVEVNCCSSGEAFEQSEWDRAFGWSPDRSQGVYIGWNGNYVPYSANLVHLVLPIGQNWTQAFWSCLGDGFDVDDAFNEMVEDNMLNPVTLIWAAFTLTEDAGEYYAGETTWLKE